MATPGLATPGTATCGEWLVQLLEAYGVELVFGIPGVHTVELYRGLVDSPYFLGFVYEEDGVVKGFIAGSIDAEAMMRTLMRSRALVLGAAAATGVLKRPQVLGRLSQTLRYFKVSDADQDPDADSHSHSDADSHSGTDSHGDAVVETRAVRRTPPAGPAGGFYV